MVGAQNLSPEQMKVGMMTLLFSDPTNFLQEIHGTLEILRHKRPPDEATKENSPGQGLHNAMSHKGLSD